MAVRSVSRIIKGIATLEGGGFLVARFRRMSCRSLIRSFFWTRWGRWTSGPEKPWALPIIRIAGLKQ